MRVFVSYRRRDVGGHAGRLTDALVQRFGARNVFHDVSTLRPGDDFGTAIERALDGSDVVVAAIGPDWPGRRADGTPRLHDDEDYVRLELATALRRGARVVPVLLGGAALPDPESVPEDLRGLLGRQAAVVDDESWHRDVDALVRALQHERPACRRLSRAAGAAALVLVLVVAGAGAGAWVWWPSPGEGEQASSSGGEPPPCAPAEGPEWQPLTLASDPTASVEVDGGQLRYTVRDARARRDGDGWQVRVRTSMENATSEQAYHGSWHYDSLAVGQRAFATSCFTPEPDLVGAQRVGDAVVGFDVACEPAGYLELDLEQVRLGVTQSREWAPC